MTHGPPESTQTINLESTQTINLEETTPDDTAIFLLEHFGLPTEDIHEPEVNLYQARHRAEIVGIGGFEIHGDDALLRSIAVKPTARGNGYGSEICRGLELRIEARQCNAIYLLTEDADPFFEAIGYERTDRAMAPNPIRQTHEFAELCPATAVCMKKII